ncbi:holo-ACP synthase [Herpetosiphon llansteffanensis]|uniref:holo-ACP synthase n=1 Tax=Herpetosiphon llansteffanensis TaxID=2094568 RepID=UPI000D7C9BF5|nr:holo-ACP synthase [Herpetosiphon llansteffanensis]
MLVTGVDLIEIDRINQAVSRWGQRFARRVWTEAEWLRCRDSAQSLAARWAAKEAAAKALGVGLKGIGHPACSVAWREIEVANDPQGKPMLRLHGAAQQRSEELGIRHWSVSLSHSGDQAIAFVVGMS